MSRKLYRILKIALVALLVVFVYNYVSVLVFSRSPQRKFETQIDARKYLKDPAIRKSAIGKTDKISIFTESYQVEESDDVLVGEVEILDKNVEQVDVPKRNTVKAMMLHAWRSYVKYAWGYNELRPLERAPYNKGVFGSYNIGATIIDALDTLYIMGLKDQYLEARDWVEHSFTMDEVKSDMSVFETTIRFVGGFLSLYALTGDSLYKEKAKYVADKLTPAFDTPTGIPYSLVNFKTGAGHNYGFFGQEPSSLAAIGSLHLEFAYLSEVTGEPEYQERVEKIRDVLQEIDKPDGFYYNFIYPNSAEWEQNEVSIGSSGDSFYEYLLKSWLQSDKEDKRAIDMFESAMATIDSHLLRTSPKGLLYIPIMLSGSVGNRMEHLACFSGGLYALAAFTRNDTYSQKYMAIAKNITNTCHESYVRTATRLGPDAFRFTEEYEAETRTGREKAYFLRPETVESYFILWRLTHDQKYRDWGWEVVNALNQHCLTANGFTGLEDVYDIKGEWDDVQQSFFLAETLKYLYLLFSDDSLISLDEWVFNTEAHPLPIKNVNKYYRRL